MGNLWNTPADPDLDLFPDMTEEEIIESLNNIDLDEIENDEEFQRRLKAFSHRRLSAETLNKIIY